MWLGLEPNQNPQYWSQDLMKLRFLMSHHKKNSVRNKVIVRIGFYSEIHSIDRMWASKEDKCGSLEMSIYGLNNFID